MTKRHIEFVLSGYGVPFTDSLADKLLEMFDEEAASYQHTINKLNKALSENNGEWVPITKWTPANDPPKETGRYLVYIVNEYDEGLQYIMTADYIARPIPIEGLSPWYVDDECASDNVVAWMPLPEGYKQEGDK